MSLIPIKLLKIETNFSKSKVKQLRLTRMITSNPEFSRTRKRVTYWL